MESQFGKMRVLQMDDGCTARWMCSAPLACTLKNVTMVNFLLCVFYHLNILKMKKICLWHLQAFTICSLLRVFAHLPFWQLKVTLNLSCSWSLIPPEAWGGKNAIVGWFHYVTPHTTPRRKRLQEKDKNTLQDLKNNRKNPQLLSPFSPLLRIQTGKSE